MTMTREEFERFLQTIRYGITVASPYDIVKCTCSDINCHGWRLVPQWPRAKA